LFSAPQALPGDVLVIIAQALKNSKQGCRARYAMLATCRYWNEVLSSEPLCWEELRPKIAYWFRNSPHLIYSKEGLLLLQRGRFSLEDVLDIENEYMDRTLLYVMGRKGDVDMLRFLIAHFNFNAEDARRDDNMALRSAAEHGQVRFLETLVDLFGLGVEDARACNNQALQWAVEKGRVDVFNVLFDRFGLTVQDIHPHPNSDYFMGYYFVHHAMTFESYNVMLALMEKYNLPAFATTMSKWHERALMSGNPQVWWSNVDTDFFRLFLAHAESIYGPRFK